MKSLLSNLLIINVWIFATSPAYAFGNKIAKVFETRMYPHTASVTKAAEQLVASINAGTHPQTILDARRCSGRVRFKVRRIKVEYYMVPRKGSLVKTFSFITDYFMKC